jgi:hypothetical protein
LIPLSILSAPFIVIYFRKTWKPFKERWTEKKEKDIRRKALWNIIDANNKREKDEP